VFFFKFSNDGVVFGTLGKFTLGKSGLGISGTSGISGTLGSLNFGSAVIT
jgi:hypothetical protein